MSEKSEKFDFSKEEITENFLNENFPVATENSAEKKGKGHVKIKREEIEKLISFGETTESLFDKIGKRGYLFHGSKSGNIEKLEPRKPIGSGKRLENLENLQEAIYATDIPAIAIFHAVRGCVKGEWSVKAKKEGYRAGWEVIKGNNNDKISIKFKANQNVVDDIEDGYVYIFKKQEFEHCCGAQFVKNEKCSPSHIIPVKKEDFQHEIEIINEKNS